MPDFNIKEIERLRYKIKALGRALVAGVAVLVVSMYYDWPLLTGPLIVALVTMQTIKWRWGKRLKQQEFLARMVEERTIELRVQRDQVMKESKELSQALQALSEAQDELVRNERLATVGQLTKGLVDRILNPLNYINNFASLSAELVSDLRRYIDSPDAVLLPEARADSVEILAMLAGNLGKITEHGANTVRIVKAMEELLKGSGGDMILTDINNLCKVNLDVIAKLYEKEIADRRISLHFHGLALPLMIEINIEQMSKVLLNLFHNSMYALLKKAEKQTYIPELLIKIHKEADVVVLTIRDNGTGIAPNIMERIFEPFFTTKPTSKASGTGLYRSREIILSHKGTIHAVSEQDHYAEFIITLPIYRNQERAQMEKQDD